MPRYSYRWTLLLTLVSCGVLEPETGPSPALLTTASEVVLGYGEARTIAGSVVRLSFGDVLEDSRCPMDVTCVWEGNARVVIGIAAGMGPTFGLELNTALEPRSADWNGVRVTLLEVTPAPVSTEPIPLQDYAVRIGVEPLS